MAFLQTYLLFLIPPHSDTCEPRCTWWRGKDSLGAVSAQEPRASETALFRVVCVMTIFMSPQTALDSSLGNYTSASLKCLSGSETVCMLVTPGIL